MIQSEKNRLHGGMVVALKKPGFFTANAQIDSPLHSHTLVEEISSSLKMRVLHPLTVSEINLRYVSKLRIRKLNQY